VAEALPSLRGTSSQPVVSLLDLRELRLGVRGLIVITKRFSDDLGKPSFWSGAIRLQKFWQAKGSDMGGWGSGRWGWHRKKRTVEEFAAIDIDALIRAGLFDYDTGLIEWESPNPENTAKHSFRYEMQHFSDSPKYRHLRLVRSSSRRELEWLVLMSKPQPLGGVRWYFFCPMSCHRPVRKLYLDAESWFGCRICRELTYTSSQTHDRQFAEFQHYPERFEAAVKRDWRLALKGFQSFLANDRRWRHEASDRTLTITGNP